MCILLLSILFFLVGIIVGIFAIHVAGGVHISIKRLPPAPPMPRKVS